MVKRKERKQPSAAAAKTRRSLRSSVPRGEVWDKCCQLLEAKMAETADADRVLAADAHGDEPGRPGAGGADALQLERARAAMAERYDVFFGFLGNCGLSDAASHLGDLEISNPCICWLVTESVDADDACSLPVGSLSPLAVALYTYFNKRDDLFHQSDSDPPPPPEVLAVAYLMYALEGMPACVQFLEQIWLKSSHEQPNVSLHALRGVLESRPDLFGLDRLLDLVWLRRDGQDGTVHSLADIEIGCRCRYIDQELEQRGRLWKFFGPSNLNFGKSSFLQSFLRRPYVIDGKLAGVIQEFVAVGGRARAAFVQFVLNGAGGGNEQAAAAQLVAENEPRVRRRSAYIDRVVDLMARMTHLPFKSAVLDVNKPPAERFKYRLLIVVLQGLDCAFDRCPALYEDMLMGGVIKGQLECLIANMLELDLTVGSLPAVIALRDGPPPAPSAGQQVWLDQWARVSEQAAVSDALDNAFDCFMAPGATMGMLEVALGAAHQTVARMREWRQMTEADRGDCMVRLKEALVRLRDAGALSPQSADDESQFALWFLPRRLHRPLGCLGGERCHIRPFNWPVIDLLPRQICHLLEQIALGVRRDLDSPLLAPDRLAVLAARRELLAVELAALTGGERLVTSEQSCWMGSEEQPGDEPVRKGVFTGAQRFLASSAAPAITASDDPFAGLPLAVRHELLARCGNRRDIESLAVASDAMALAVETATFRGDWDPCRNHRSQFVEELNFVAKLAEIRAEGAVLDSLQQPVLPHNFASLSIYSSSIQSTIDTFRGYRGPFVMPTADFMLSFPDKRATSQGVVKELIKHYYLSHPLP